MVEAESTAIGDLKPRIVVVEDDESILKSLEWILGSFGYRPLLFASGEEALAGVAVSERSGYPLLLIDLSLPGMRGDVFVRRWIESLAAPASPVEVLFCSALQEGELRLAAAGLADLLPEANIRFLRKPFRLGEIESTLRSMSDGMFKDAAA